MNLSGKLHVAFSKIHNDFAPKKIASLSLRLNVNK